MEDWDDYRYFLAVAKEGSLSAASRELKVSQPTVSRRISQLEQRLSIRLFDQLPTGMQLTAPAREIVTIAENLENSAIELRRRVAGRETDLAGPITITATQSFATCWLAQRIAAFSEQYPEIEITCLAENQVLNLARREADLAIRFGQPSASGLVGSRVGTVHCGIYGSKNYFDAYGLPQSLEDLQHHRLIDTADPIAQFQQSKDLKALMNDAVVSSRTNCPYTYIALARAGQGLISTTCYMTARAPELMRVLADEYDKKIELWMLIHPDMKGCARVRVFMDFIRDELRRDQQLLIGAQAS